MDDMVPEMKPFARFAGRTWTGRGPDGELADVSRWEFILGGRALQVTHRLVGDSYGGRSIVFFDQRSGDFVTHYFTTAGFYTVGLIKPTDAGFAFEEEVRGNSGVTKVRGTVTLDGGKMVSRSSYLRDGHWVPGHAFTYEESPGVEVGY